MPAIMMDLYVNKTQAMSSRILESSKGVKKEQDKKTTKYNNRVQVL